MRKTIWNATGFVAYGVLFAVAALVGVKYTMASLRYDIPVLGTPAIDDGIDYRGLLDQYPMSQEQIDFYNRPKKSFSDLVQNDRNPPPNDSSQLGMGY